MTVARSDRESARVRQLRRRQRDERRRRQARARKRRQRDRERARDIVTGSVTSSVTSPAPLATPDPGQNTSAAVTDADHGVTRPVTLPVTPVTPSADEIAKRVVALLEDRVAPRPRCRWDGCPDPHGAPLEESLAELNPFCSGHRTQLRCSVSWRARFAISDAVALPCAIPGCPRPVARRGLCWTHYKKLDELPEEAKVSGPRSRPVRG